MDELMRMPENKELDVLMIFSLLKELVAPTYLQGKNLLPYIILRMFKLTLLHGNTSTSSFVYSAYGLLWSKLGFPGEAYKFGKLAMEYNRLVDNPPMEARCYFMATSFCIFWKRPLKETVEPRKQGLQKLMATGEFFWASYIYMFGFWQEVVLSKSVEDVASMAEREVKFSRKVKQIEPFHVHTLHRNLFINLMGGIKEKVSLALKEGEEEEALNYFSTNVTSTCGVFYHTTCKLVLLYLYGHYREAVEIAVRPEVTEEVINDPTYSQTIYTFFTCLAILAEFKDFNAGQKSRYRKALNKRKNKIKKWHSHCPENFEVMWTLVLAEEARVAGGVESALDLYNQAIKAAEKMESLFFEALANELCARFWLSGKQEKCAKVYMSEAFYLYQRWGATAKGEDLEKKYPWLIKEKRVGRASADIDSSSASSTSVIGFLDTTTVIKASQALSGEIILEKLLGRLVKILIENAGAQRGALILEKEGRLFVEAHGEVEKEEVSVLQNMPLEECPDFPKSIINYTARAMENVVLCDAAHEGEFTEDPYVQDARAKSILSMPIMKQGRLIGILYLENNLLEEAFTPERLELLEVLSSQMAISIENALFYNVLEQKVTERTRELEQSREQLVESEKMAALGGLVAGVAHEINTPVGNGVTAASSLNTSTKKIAESYRSGELTSEEYEEYLETALEGTEIILRNLTYAAELIKSFKMVAIDQSSEAKRDFNLGEYIKEVLLSLQPQLKNTKVKIGVECHKDIFLSSYPGAFSQIITNLVLNSLMHAYDKGSEGNIRIQCSMDANFMTFHYTDDGKGIGPESINKIFDPFFTTNRQAGGTGLGMHILYNLVTQKLKGTINCQSSLGKGVCFKIRVPV
jgi:signal transduction histidine kinase